MKKLLQIAAVTVLSLGLATGSAAAATGGTVERTGPDSDTTIRSIERSDVDYDVTNDVSAHLDNDQDAYSGDARSTGNTEGGSAETGMATNESTVDVQADIDNSGVNAGGSHAPAVGDWSGGDVSTTGPDSSVTITTEHRSSVDVDVTNDVDFSVTNDQDASSGDATVSHNTEGGNATSGAASNTSSTSFVLNIKN